MKTDPKKARAVLDALEKAEKGKIIYPGALKKECGAGIEEIYEMLHAYSEKGLLREVLELWCPQCRHVTGAIYGTIPEVPDEFTCPRCGRKVWFPLEHAVVVYLKAGPEDGSAPEKCEKTEK